MLKVYLKDRNKKMKRKRIWLNSKKKGYEIRKVSDREKKSWQLDDVMHVEKKTRLFKIDKKGRGQLHINRIDVEAS